MAEQVNQELAGVLETIETTGRGALTELRGLLHVIRAADETDLAPPRDLNRLDELIDGIRRAGVDVRSTLAFSADLPVGVGLCAYRTVQEGLTNAMRHADGSPVDLEVTSDRSALRVRVHTTGGSGRTPANGTGTGLIGLRERVLLSGGRLTAGPDATGYLLDVSLPLAADPDATDDPQSPPVGAPS
jgi:signal transduction histidine kinase